jgi:hypothetical protein
MNIHDTIITVLGHPMTVKDAERFANWCADRAKLYADSARETSRKADEEYVAKRDAATSASKWAIYLSDTIDELEDDDPANVTTEDEDFERIANFAGLAAVSLVGEREAQLQLQWIKENVK